MLPQTKQAVAALKEAGLNRKQFSIRTPWKKKIQDYGETIILIICPYAQIAPCMQKLAGYFKVIVAVLDGIPCDISIDTTKTPGLYKLENGHEMQVEEIVLNGSFEQLQLWDAGSFIA